MNGLSQGRVPTGILPCFFDCGFRCRYLMTYWRDQPALRVWQQRSID